MRVAGGRLSYVKLKCAKQIDAFTIVRKRIPNCSQLCCVFSWDFLGD